jgi:hypothetical protein
MITDLGVYASNVSRSLRWRTENPDELPGGETPKSIVSKAIQLVLKGALEESSEDASSKAGSRRWDPQKHSELKKYLMDVIDSLLNHLANSSENKIFTKIPDKGIGKWEAGVKPRTADTEWLARTSRSPEQLLLQREKAELEDRALDMLEAEVAGDKVLSKVIRAMRESEGRAEAPDIAKATGIPIRDVYNANKRLDRKAGEIFRKLGGMRTETAKRRARR